MKRFLRPAPPPTSWHTYVINKWALMPALFHSSIQFRNLIFVTVLNSFHDALEATATQCDECWLLILEAGFNLEQEDRQMDEHFPMPKLEAGHSSAICTIAIGSIECFQLLTLEALDALCGTGSYSYYGCEFWRKCVRTSRFEILIRTRANPLGAFSDILIVNTCPPLRITCHFSKLFQISSKDWSTFFF